MDLMVFLFILFAQERSPAVEKTITLENSPYQTPYQKNLLKQQLEQNGFQVVDNIQAGQNSTSFYILGALGLVALALMGLLTAKQSKKETAKQAKILSFQAKEQQQEIAKEKIKR